MQNLDSYKQKPRSISRTLSAGLIITLVLVAGLSLGVNFILSARKAKAELETRADEYISALTDALKIPLWNYSEETIAVICESYAQNEFVTKLLLEDQKGTVLFKKEKVDQRLVVSRSRDIFYEGNLIGRVQIALTSGYYTAVNRQLFQSVSLTIIIMIGALLVMTGVLLRQLLKKPISQFIKMVDKYAAGESDAFKQGTPYREFRPLLDVLNKMGAKIASQKQDITEQKRAEQALRESRAKYRNLVEYANCIIFQMDTRGNITFFNRFAQDFFGYSEAEILGRNVVGTIAPVTDSSGRNRIPRDIRIMKTKIYVEMGNWSGWPGQTGRSMMMKIVSLKSFASALTGPNRKGLRRSSKIPSSDWRKLSNQFFTGPHLGD